MLFRRMRAWRVPSRACARSLGGSAIVSPFSSGTGAAALCARWRVRAWRLPSRARARGLTGPAIFSSFALWLGAATLQSRGRLPLRAFFQSGVSSDIRSHSLWNLRPRLSRALTNQTRAACRDSLRSWLGRGWRPGRCLRLAVDSSPQAEVATHTPRRAVAHRRWRLLGGGCLGGLLSSCSLRRNVSQVQLVAHLLARLANKGLQLWTLLANDCCPWLRRLRRLRRLLLQRATSRTLMSLLSGHASRRIASLTESTKPPLPSGIVYGRGQLKSDASLNLGRPARSLSSTTPTG